MTEKLAREAVCKAYAESGLDYFLLTRERMSALRNAINPHGAKEFILAFMEAME